MAKTTRAQIERTVSDFLKMDEQGRCFISGYMIGRIEKFNEEKHGVLINEAVIKKPA